MDPLKYFFLFLAVAAVAAAAFGSVKTIADARVDAAAAQAGLVQQVVKVPYNTPITIWVKPPAPSLVESK